MSVHYTDQNGGNAHCDAALRDGAMGHSGQIDIVTMCRSVCDCDATFLTASQ